MRAIFSVPAAGLFAVAACAPSDNTRMDTPAQVAVTCNAAEFESLRGEPLAIVDTISTPLEVRILRADAFVPRDFDPNRLTFTEARDGTVSRIFCG